MKILLILIATVSIARANLIDLTPGGFDLTQPLSVEVQHFFAQYGHGMQNLAGANIVNGQVVWSPFTIFGDDHFDITLNGTGADVGWDLTGTGFRGLFVFTESPELFAHLYLMPFSERFEGDGFVDINGVIPIGAVTFTGTNWPVPDTGSTLALMSIGLLGLWAHSVKDSIKIVPAPAEHVHVFEECPEVDQDGKELGPTHVICIECGMPKDIPDFMKQMKPITVLPPYEPTCGDSETTQEFKDRIRSGAGTGLR